MAKFGIGQPVRRVEDKRFLQGAGRYVDDIVLPRMAHAKVVYSQHAHADILSVDVAAAKAMPGVLLVLTGASDEMASVAGMPPYFMPADAGGPPGYRTLRPILCKDRVRCVGDRIAIVVAETADQARDAADKINFGFAPLPAVTTPAAALADDAPRIWEDCPGNTSFRMEFGNRAETDAAFAKAAHVVSIESFNNRISANSIEPRCAVADWPLPSGTATLYTSSQNPHGVRHMIAMSVLGIPEGQLRVVSPDVGGGFGMKADAYAEDVLVLVASRSLGRPVKWVATRSESLMGDNHGRDQHAIAELALDAKGKALGLRVRASHAVGAYVASATVAPVTQSMRMLPGVYDIPACDVSTSAVFTNTSPTGPYRGAGRPEACYMLERLMDDAAVKLGIDQVEIRRRNLIRADQMPHQVPTGNVYDSGDFPQMMDAALALGDWDGFAARKAASNERGMLRGRAVTCYVECAGIFNERMELRFDPEGNVAILAGTHSHGQGHATTYAQIVHEMLGIPIESIQFLQGDTDVVPIGRGTYAARSSLLGGNALRAASVDAIAKARAMAAHLLEVPVDEIEFDSGVFRAGTSNLSISFTDTAKAFYRPVGMPGGISVGFTTSGFASGDFPNFPNGAHVCEVEVDTRTGVVHIDRFAVVDDVGRVLNPMICEGQVIGGIAQGLGQAMLEEVLYDPATGQLISGSFSDYGMPRAGTMPHIKSELREITCTTNALGVKGVGESGTIAAPPTIVNAVLDALRPIGVKDIRMPLTPARVWETIRAASGELERETA